MFNRTLPCEHCRITDNNSCKTCVEDVFVGRLQYVPRIQFEKDLDYYKRGLMTYAELHALNPNLPFG